MARPDKIGDRLDELDRRYVPRLAAAARRATDRATDVTDRARGRDLRGEARTLLRRADAAAAQRLPGRTPRALAAALAAVLVAGGAYAVVRDGDDRDALLEAAATPVPTPTAPTGPYSYSEQDPRNVGPALGTTVDAYLTLTRAELRVSTATGPDNKGIGLVHLRAYATPAQAADLVKGLRPLRAIARVPGTGAQTSLLQAVATTLPEDIVSAYDEKVVRKEGEAAALEDAATRFPVGSPERRRSEEAARVARQEVDAYRGRCACVYALVVEAPVKVLAALGEDPRVRAVDLAPPGSLVDDLNFRGLIPEQNATVAPPS